MLSLRSIWREGGYERWPESRRFAPDPSGLRSLRMTQSRWN